MEALGINLPGLIGQIINFVLLLIILRAVAYGPIMKMLDERQTRIRESLQRVETIQAEAGRAQEEVQAQLAAARREGQEIVAQAAQIAERIKEEARTEARKEAEALLARARADIELERDRAIAQLREDFADLTILAASKVINRSLDKAAHRDLIESVLTEDGRARA